MAKKEKVYLFDHSHHLRDEWDYEKNGDLDPEKLTFSSNKKVWWICSLNHSYLCMVANKVRKNQKCVFCTGHKVLLGFNDIGTYAPDLLRELVDKSLVGRLTKGSNLRVEWACSLGHTWFNTVNSRYSNKTGCPFCSGRRPVQGVSDLSISHPEIFLTLVDKSAIVSAKSEIKLQWKCTEGHLFEMSVKDRTRSTGSCPTCSNRRVLVGFNDLKTMNPDIAIELVDTDPESLMYRSTKKVLWRCINHHTYMSSPESRTVLGRGCSICTNKTVLQGYNDLGTTDPTLSLELVDISLAKTVTKSSGVRMDWKCSNGHVWNTSPHQRSSGRGCARCMVVHSSKVELSLRTLLSDSFTVSEKNHRIPVKWGTRKSMSVDIEIMNLPYKCVVEYDGCYWHRTTHIKDSSKTLTLLESNYLVIRVREQGTIKLSRLDIQHPNLLQLSVPYSTKDDNLIEAVEKIKEWLDSKQQEKML